ncbi:MAG TPA: hypothetical protein VM537_06805 [Anaerolineae bacterium]|nr:hypothetical protein [Anaerolineae bacterium]
MTKELAETLDRVFVSPNCQDANGEDANVVDGLYAIASAIRSLATAIRDVGLADAGTSMGAIEVLAGAVKEVADAVSTRG